MKILKIISAILCLATCVVEVNAQIVARYTSAPRCIFLKSSQALYVKMIYYDHGGSSEMNIRQTQGFSIDENVNKGINGASCLTLTVYKSPMLSDIAPMTINLHFATMPDTVNYYLNVPELKPGPTIDVNIPATFSKKTAIGICCKGQPIIDNSTGITWPPVPGYDITDIVFPPAEKKDN